MVNFYPFGKCNYFCCEVIKHFFKEDDTVKIKVMSNKLKVHFGKFYNDATIGTSLRTLASDGHIIRESVTMRGEVIYLTPEQHAKIKNEKEVK